MRRQKFLLSFPFKLSINKIVFDVGYIMHRPNHINNVI